MNLAECTSQWTGVCRDCRLNMPTVMAALLRCTSNGHLECMKALVAAGADVNGVVEDPACPCGKCPIPVHGTEKGTGLHTIDVCSSGA